MVFAEIQTGGKDWIRPSRRRARRDGPVFDRAGAAAAGDAVAGLPFDPLGAAAANDLVRLPKLLDGPA